MRVLCIVNPRSGRGRGPELARRFVEAARADALLVDCWELERGGDLMERLTAALEASNGLLSYERIVVVGGDGTFRRLLPALSLARIPVYMLPAGNESLVARHFGMRTSPPDVLRSLVRGKISSHKFGWVNDAPFFLMVSIGLDAAVVEEVSARRTGTIHHLDYLTALFRASRRFRLPDLELTATGVASSGEEPTPSEPLRRAWRGSIIIANCPAYARGLNPIGCASSASIHLSGKISPPFSIKEYAGIVRALLCRRALDLPGEVISAQCFSVRSPQGEQLALQADGDFIGYVPAEIRTSRENILICEGAAKT